MRARAAVVGCRLGGKGLKRPDGGLGCGGKGAENSPQRRRFLPPNLRYRDLCGFPFKRCKKARFQSIFRKLVVSELKIRIQDLSFPYVGNSERLQGLLGRRRPCGRASLQPPCSVTFPFPGASADKIDLPVANYFSPLGSSHDPDIVQVLTNGFE
jgi:hypothetical protein